MLFGRKKQKAPPEAADAAPPPAETQESAPAAPPLEPDGDPYASVPASGVGGRESGAATTQFLTGDQLTDRKTVQVLLDAITKVSTSLDLDELLIEFVDRSIEVTGAERGILLLCNANGALEPRVARQRGAKSIAGELRFSTTVAGKVLEQGQPVRATVHSENQAMNLGQSVYDLKLRAVMCVPLRPPARERGEPLDRSRTTEPAPNGVLYVDSRAATRQFSHRDLSLFYALAQQMAVALENARLHLDSVEKVRLEASLQTAREIQKDLIPPLPRDIAGYDLYAWFSPAEKTAGDFYDFVKLRDGRFAIVVGDVTGHGIGPALISSAAQGSLRSSLRFVPHSGEVVTALNQDLCERVEDGRFLTLFLGLLDPHGKLEALNAGHAEPLWWRARDGSVQRLRRGGPALGMIPDAVYEPSDRIELDRGDVLVVYSDGLSEAKAAADPEHLFGEDGLMQALTELAAAPNGSAESIAMGLVARVLAHSGQKFEDDMSVLVVRRNASA
ncbi:MAG: GAF domain-containing protein [Planctomycetota bacterium]|nr:MAG: GAF domain-containing protein [Planctomycetota bacterium]